MNGFGWTTCGLAVALLGCGSSEPSSPLALGSLYQGFENTSGGNTPASNYYLKFIDDDTVLNTVTADPPNQIQTWFQKGNQNVNSERYQLEGNTIRIVYNIASQYDGTIDGDRIFFNVTSTGDPPMYVRNFVLLH